MRKSVKKTAMLLLAAILAVCCFAVTACGSKDELKFELAESVDAEVGQEFTLPAPLIEFGGERLFASVSVKDADGGDVTVNDNKIFIGKLSDYTATYSVSYGKSQTASKSLTVHAVDNGTPNIDAAAYELFAVKGDTVTVPEVTVTDASGEEITPTYTLKYGDEEETALTEDSFLAAKEGTYVITVSAADKSGNSDSKEIRVTAAYEEDAVFYFGHKGGEAAVKPTDGVSYVSSDTVKHGADKASMNVKSTYGFTDVVIPFPAIKDISSASAMFGYIYNDSAFEVNVTMNQVFSLNKIAPKTWGLIEIINDGNVWKTQSGKYAFYKDFYDDASIDASEKNEKYIATNPASAADLSGFKFSVEGREGSALNVYFSTFKILNDGTAPTFDFTAAFVPGRVDEPYEITPPTAVPHGAGATASVTGVSVMKPDATVENIAKNESGKFVFTPTAEGKYTLLFKAEDSRDVAAYEGRTLLIVTPKEKEILSLDVPYLDDLLSTNSVAVGARYYHSTDADTFYKDGESHLLRINSAEMNGNVNIFPMITDIDEFESIYYYIYNPMNYDTNTYVNGKAELIVSLKAGRWTRVEYGKAKFQHFCDSDNIITKFTMTIDQSSSGTDNVFYMTPIRARAAGDAAAPVISVTGPNKPVALNETVTVPTATAEDATVTYTVCKPDGTPLTGITDGTFTAAEEGVYKIAYTAVKGWDLSYAEITVTCTEFNDGDLMLLDKENSFAEFEKIDFDTAHDAAKKANENEEGSLKITGKGVHQYFSIGFKTFLMSDISDYDAIQFWIYNDNAAFMTCYFNNAAPHFDLQSKMWNLIDIRKDGGEWFLYKNGVKGGKVAITSTDFKQSGFGYMKLTFDAKSEISDAPVFYLSRMRAVKGTVPTIVNGIGSAIEKGATVDTKLFTAADATVTVESIIAPDGTPVTLDENKCFTATQEGDYTFAVSAATAAGIKNRVLFTVTSGPAMLLKLNGDVSMIENVNGTTNIVSNEAIVHEDDKYSFRVNGNADWDGIEFRINFTEKDLTGKTIKFYYYKASPAYGEIKLINETNTETKVEIQPATDASGQGHWIEVSISNEQLTTAGYDKASLSSLRFTVGNSNYAGDFVSHEYQFLFSSFYLE